MALPVRILDRVHANGAFAVCLSLLLIVNLVVIWETAGATVYFMGADEAQWIVNATKSWQTRTGSPISHVPLFHDLVAPFVSGALIDTMMGYYIWKFLIFYFSSLALFYVTTKASNLWIGFIITLHYQFAFQFGSPTYSYLAMLFFLLALALIVYKREWLGYAFGILLLGLLVRLDLGLFAITSFALLCVFAPKRLFTRAFLKQVTVPAIIFVLLIYWHGSSLVRFPRDYLFRGQQSVVWYVIDFMVNEGYFDEYTDTPRMGLISNEIIDTVLVRHFGKNLQALNNSSFLELWELNPSIMRLRYGDLYLKLGNALLDPLRVTIPYGDFIPRRTYFAMFMAIAVVPSIIVGLFRKKQRFVALEASRSNRSESLVKQTMRLEFYLFVASGISGFVPWLMTFPQYHYIVMAMPTFYVAVAFVLQASTDLTVQPFGSG